MPELAASNFFKNNKILLIFIGIIFIGLIIFLGLKLEQEKGNLSNSLKNIAEENKKLKFNLEEKENKILELRDVQAIKLVLNTAQANIEELNRELNKIRGEKLVLQDANIDLSNRLANTGREFSKTFDELRRAKEELANLGRSEVLPLKKKAEELVKLQDSYNKLAESNKSLQDRLTSLQKEAQVQNAPVQALLDNINKLNQALAQKEKQINDLQAQAANINYAKEGFEGAEGQLKIAKEPQAGTKELRIQITRLSEIIANKELELGRIRKESKDINERLLNAQARVSVLERNLTDNQIDKDKIKQLEAEKFNSQSRLREIQDELAKKTELADSLQKNLNYLNQQLGRKEEEKKDYETKLSRSAELEALYNNLRTQVLQLSEFVNTKDRELEQRRNEVESLKEELAKLKSESLKLEKELTEARERQKKTLDDLSVTLKLNAALQERISGGLSSSGQPDLREKEKTEELKRKIEVILSTENR